MYSEQLQLTHRLVETLEVSNLKSMVGLEGQAEPGVVAMGLAYRLQRHMHCCCCLPPERPEFRIR